MPRVTFRRTMENEVYFVNEKHGDIIASHSYIGTEILSDGRQYCVCFWRRPSKVSEVVRRERERKGAGESRDGPEVASRESPVVIVVIKWRLPGGPRPRCLHSARFGRKYGVRDRGESGRRVTGCG